MHIAGKTGTATAPNTARTHGLFVGYAPADQPEIALVVYLPQGHGLDAAKLAQPDRKSTRLNSSHGYISYAVFCLKKKNTIACATRPCNNTLYSVTSQYLYPTAV